ncbi:hypothetical protein D3C78_1979690 [compost metagenome]
MREAALQILGGSLSEDVVKKEALQLRNKMVKQRLGKACRRQQQNVMQAERTAG